MGNPDPQRSREKQPPLRGARRKPRREAAARRSFTATWKVLDELAASGARLSVRVEDLDNGEAVLAGDDHRTLPVAGLGVVPLLLETAAAFEDGRLDPLEIVDRQQLPPVAVAGVWQHLKAPALPLADLAVLASATGDALATNALLERVGLPAVRSRLESLGIDHTALMDGFRNERGPDDAPQVALGTARELAGLFSSLVNARAVSPGVSAQVSEWLSLNVDLTLAASATGLDPFAHEDDAHGLLFVNKTGRGDGIRAEGGVLAGPRAGVAYAMLVAFDDLSIAHRLRVHEAFRTLGVELMEYVY
ncbi:serine hydrolase [Microbacterium wangruii]|uniref:serine hydrolase n=1 Tax=Microbacterium TaxID=33882 RepID=UPI00214CE70D|nr:MULTISPECIES: serine hydrolase [unclassified Microbacterium]MCR2813218.1 class A beta-lactamase-related serine hydrolase [Microbacterium sp. zg.Y1084]MDL5487385.1 serine hydrolase [Microbacterium sp. zg-Y1211]WIM28501.1 serine hydrolase [Microbacterium sp. zg-Y1090]